MNTERYSLTKDEPADATWHIVDHVTGDDFDTCETDYAEAVKALEQHEIYSQR